MRATVDSLRTVTLPTVEVEVAEWEGTITLRALTRAQVRLCRETATLGDDKRIDLDTYDLSVLAYAMADPDLTGEVGIEEALVLLRAQPSNLIQRLVKEAVAASALGPSAPFRSGSPDDAGRRTDDGTLPLPTARRDDSAGDAAENEPA